MGAHQTDRRAMLILLMDGAAQDIAGMSLFVVETLGRHEGGHATLVVVLHQLHCRDAVFLEDHAFPRLDCVVEFVVAVAQHLLPARREPDPPSPEIPVPDPVVAAPHRELKTLLGLLSWSLKTGQMAWLWI